MNILQITSSISRSSGGVGPVVKNLVASLRRASCKVTLCCLLEDGSFDQLPSNKGFEIVAELPSKFGFPGGSRKLTKRLRKIVPDTDILQCNCLWESCLWSAAGIAKKNGKPYIVTPHGMLDPWAINNSKWKKKIAGLLFVNKYLKNAACIHALCESEYQSIRAYGLKNPVTIIPNGIDLPEIKEDLAVPWQEQIPKDKKVMLFLGRIHPKKGLENLIKAWALLKQSAIRSQQSGWILVIAGWDQNRHENQLKQLVKQLDRQTDVLFLGPVFDDKKKACLQNAEAFILPSFSEGLPMSVLEAWSYNLPVIMTKFCNILEGFEAKAAIEIQPEPDSIAEELAKFIELPESELKLLGQNGLELVKNKFSWSQIAAQMVEVYKWILSQGDKPECVKLH